ncbi:YpzI family protein [Jeotgalibacillus proteolyticus]|uniref:YpzI family protein n=1 Tax=Jeotgalibacillus proteolyticus TaxID=2082395 RepID=A0A2S5GD15_9BACL|nr:YpzI family protein [Jeotgalibacillus proteolyticus]PPA70932.1 YpzI family protein [Jeotgalibacillus proteolyticus]
MGKDRQEKKLKKEKKVQSDRDQSLHYPGAAGSEKDGGKSEVIEQ